MRSHVFNIKWMTKIIQNVRADEYEHSSFDPLKQSLRFSMKVLYFADADHITFFKLIEPLLIAFKQNSEHYEQFLSTVCEIAMDHPNAQILFVRLQCKYIAKSLSLWRLNKNRESMEAISKLAENELYEPDLLTRILDGNIVFGSADYRTESDTLWLTDVAEQLCGCRKDWTWQIIGDSVGIEMLPQMKEAHAAWKSKENQPQQTACGACGSCTVL